MKKAIGLAALNFLGTVALWTLLELLYLRINGGDFVQSCADPYNLILCGCAASYMAVIAFVNERKKKLQQGILAIR